MQKPAVKKESATQKEIFSQPTVWKKTLATWSELDLADYPHIQDFDDVLYIGCGSTFFLSRWAARVSERVTGKVTRAAPSSEIFLHPDMWLRKNRRTLLIASSRSAATTETVKAIRFFKENFKGEVVGITCNPDEKMGEETPYIIAAPEAQEESIAQTRSFTSMMLGHALFLERKIPDDVKTILQTSSENLLSTYQNTISNLARDEAIQRFFYLGSGPLYGLACECMLKMKEISLSYAEAFHTLEFRHGPMSMVDESTLVIGLIGNTGIDEEAKVLQEMAEKGAQTIAIGDLSSSKFETGLTINLNAELPLLWRSVLYLPAMQWLAHERGLHKGLDPDQPHHLEAVVVLDE